MGPFRFAFFASIAARRCRRFSSRRRRSSSLFSCDDRKDVEGSSHAFQSEDMSFSGSFVVDRRCVETGTGFNGSSSNLVALKLSSRLPQSSSAASSHPSVAALDVSSEGSCGLDSSRRLCSDVGGWGEEELALFCCWLCS